MPHKKPVMHECAPFADIPQRFYYHLDFDTEINNKSSIVAVAIRIINLN